jgi:hypothetical protein
MTEFQANIIIGLLAFYIAYRVVQDGIKAFSGDRL